MLSLYNSHFFSSLWRYLLSIGSYQRLITMLVHDTNPYYIIEFLVSKIFIFSYFFADVNLTVFKYNLNTKMSNLLWFELFLDTKELIVSDPFRDLVLSSEIDVGEEELATLAEAAVLSVMSVSPSFFFFN